MIRLDSNATIGIVDMPDVSGPLVLVVGSEGAGLISWLLVSLRAASRHCDRSASGGDSAVLKISPEPVLS